MGHHVGIASMQSKCRKQKPKFKGPQRRPSRGPKLLCPPRAGDRSAAAASSELKRVVSLLFFLLFIVDKRSSVPPSPIESEEREKSSGQHIFEDEGQRDSDQASKGPYIKDVRKIFGFLDPLPPCPHFG